MKNLPILVSIIALIIAGAAMVSALKKSAALGGAGFVNSQSCTVSRITATTTANQLSTMVLGTTTRRAWAIIEQPVNATNTVALSFNHGAPATLTSGIDLENASTTNGLTEIRFGLNTDFPYTGSVYALTSTGSTTLKITECVY